MAGMGSNYFNFAQGPDGSSLTHNYFIDWLGTAPGRAAMNVGRRAVSCARKGQSCARKGPVLRRLGGTHAPRAEAFPSLFSEGGGPEGL